MGGGLKAFLEKKPRAEKFHGTMKDLLNQLEPWKGENHSHWPKSPRGMGDALRRLAPAFRMLGYEVINEEKRGGQLRCRIFLKPLKVSPSPGSLECHAMPA